MSLRKFMMAAAAATIAVAATTPASAQSAGYGSDADQSIGSSPSLIIFGQGGGYSPATDLNSAGTADGKTGWTVGGGVGVGLNRYVAIRAAIDFARSDIEGSGAGEFGGNQLDRLFYGGDVQLSYPTSSGFRPYLLLGAGAVTIMPDDNTGLDNVTKFAGTGGLGVAYALPSGVELYVQGNTHIYKIDDFGFDKTQADVLWTGGLSYRIF